MTEDAVNTQTLTVRKRRKKDKVESTEQSEQRSNPDQNDATTDNVQPEVTKGVKKVPKKGQELFSSTLHPYDIPLKWWEEDYVKYAITHPPVKSQLEEIMKTHIVRLTDRKYMLHLMSKIRENHNERQMERIEGRKLSPPSLISKLLMISYDTLVERINYQNRYKK